MSYAEHLPPPSLVPVVDCVWMMRPPGAAQVNRVLPDGCADVIFDLSSGAPADRRAFHVGSMTRAVVVSPPTGTMVGIRFRAGAWTRLLGIQGPESLNGTIPLDLLWPTAEAIRDRLATSPAGDRPRILFAEVERRYRSVAPMSPQVMAADRLLRRSGGRIGMGDLTAMVDAAPRQLQRLFRREAGLAPKFLARVYRLRRAAALLEGTRLSPAAVAGEAGFFDQSHLVRDMVEIAGTTPGAFRRERRVAFVQYPPPSDAQVGGFPHPEVIE